MNVTTRNDPDSTSAASEGAVATKPPDEKSPAPKRQIPTWMPLRSPVFRAVWLASLASNVGSWMHEVGASWLMTSLTRNEQMNALVSGAVSLPMFLLALPAGALADIVDRRKLIICTQTWAMFVAGTLATLTLLNVTAPWILLFFTLLMGLGSAMTGPAWQALLPEMVKRRQLPAAMSLGGVAWNLSRIVGPLLGGAIISVAAGLLPNRVTAPGVVFAVNAVSFLGVVAVFARWKRAPHESNLPPEHILSAVRAGWRYTRHSPELRAILVRNGAFMLCISAQFSLLPLYARTLLHLNASGYASLLAFFGAAAVLSNILFPRLRERFTPSQLLFYSTLANSFNLLILALVPGRVPEATAVWLVRASLLFGGTAWPIVMQTCQVTLVRSVPNWVRSRAAGMFTLVFMGSSTVGSIVWGTVARQQGIPLAFVGAAAVLLLGLIALRGFVIVDPGRANLSPSEHWPDPVMAVEPSPEEGPVLIMVEYNIALEEADAFMAAMQPVRRMRLRDGALRWDLFQDTSDPTRWLETLMAESWNEHLRQHTRITHADREIEAVAWAYHRGEDGPRVTHLIAPGPHPKADDADDDSDD